LLTSGSEQPIKIGGMLAGKPRQLFMIHCHHRFSFIVTRQPIQAGVNAASRLFAPSGDRNEATAASQPMKFMRSENARRRSQLRVFSQALGMLGK
jgi:hypothetical protein